MNDDPFVGFRAALAERLADRGLSGEDVLVIADKRGAQLANAFDGPTTATTQVVEPPVTTARILDLLSSAKLAGPPPRPPGSWTPPELEPVALPARQGWELMRAA